MLRSVNRLGASAASARAHLSVVYWRPTARRPRQRCRKMMNSTAQRSAAVPLPSRVGSAAGDERRSPGRSPGPVAIGPSLRAWSDGRGRPTVRPSVRPWRSEGAMTSYWAAASASAQ